MREIHFNGKLNYTIDNIGLVKVLRNAGFTFPCRNGKEKYSLTFVQSGEMNYQFSQSGNNIKLTEGSTLFVPKNTPYTATYNKNGTVITVGTFDINSDLLPDVFTATICKKSADLANIFKSVSPQNANSTIFLASKIYELLYILEKSSVTIPNKFKKILPALNEIQQFYMENRKISHYSDMCHMSQSNFRKLFKEYTGKSTIDYRNFIRISEAKKLIDSGEYTVAESAYLTGFNNMSFFYEAYKKYIY